jgi:hypothetical protein
MDQTGRLSIRCQERSSQGNIARGKLTPTNSEVALKGNQPWGRTLHNYFVQVCPVGVLGFTPVFIPYPPVHAPAAAAGALVAKHVLESRPALGSSRMDREPLHTRAVALPESFGKRSGFRSLHRIESATATERPNCSHSDR